MPSTNPNWLDGRLEHTLKRGREWIVGTKLNVVAELKAKATVAVADLLAAQAGPPVVRLANGDLIWGKPYQAMPVDTEIPKEVLERYKYEQEKYRLQQQNSRGIGGTVGGLLEGYWF